MIGNMKNSVMLTFEYLRGESGTGNAVQRVNLTYEISVVQYRRLSYIPLAEESN